MISGAGLYGAGAVPGVALLLWGEDLLPDSSFAALFDGAILVDFESFFWS
jgi:hypothetical protein